MLFSKEVRHDLHDYPFDYGTKDEVYFEENSRIEERDATDACEKDLRASPAYQECLTINGLNVPTIIDGCVVDVKVSICISYIIVNFPMHSAGDSFKGGLQEPGTSLSRVECSTAEPFPPQSFSSLWKLWSLRCSIPELTYGGDDLLPPLNHPQLYFWYV